MAEGTSDEFPGEREARETQQEATGFLRLFTIGAIMVTSIFGWGVIRGEPGSALSVLVPFAGAMSMGAGATLAIARHQGAKLRRIQAHTVRYADFLNNNSKSIQVPTDKGTPGLQ